ncbi:hypothetical protein IAD21_04616 [Abditibacteriota bacterium]|nr:hypothetical protein IAD21_04616 [Abditibacteriota bacterium]
MSSKRLSLLLSLGCVFSMIPLAQAAPDEAVATVDGVPVTRGTLDQTLEGIYGEQILPQLIDDQLLANALLARGQSVSDSEVNAELARFQAQDPAIKAAAESGGVRAQVVKYQIRRIVTARKLLIARIPDPTPAQLQAFFTTYAPYYGQPAQNRLGFLATATKARANQLARTLKTNSGAFNSLVNQQKQKADTDPIAGQSITDIGRFETPSEFGTIRRIPAEVVAPLVKALATAKKGQVLPVQALTPQGPFLIVKVVDRKEATTPTLAQLQPDINTDYKMAQVAQAEIKKNPRNPQKLEDNIRQVLELLAQPTTQSGEQDARPTLRDALAFMLRPASNNSLTYLRAHSSVTIADPSYSALASSYRKQP